jgi:CRP/FNR family cyclic AMP-dependent transcriptional regulator
MELSTRVGLDVDTVKRAVQQLREGPVRARAPMERLEIPDLDALRRLFALLGVKDEIRGRAGRVGLSRAKRFGGINLA